MSSDASTPRRKCCGKKHQLVSKTDRTSKFVSLKPNFSQHCTSFALINTAYILIHDSYKSDLSINLTAFIILLTAVNRRNSYNNDLSINMAALVMLLTAVHQK